MGRISRIKSRAVVFAKLIAFSVGKMKVVVRAVIIGVKAKNSKISSNAAFMFNFSPPLFFIQIFHISC